MGSEVIAHSYLRDLKLWYSSETKSDWREGTFRSEQKWNDVEIDERMDKLRLTWMENETAKPKMLKYPRDKEGRRKELLDWRLRVLTVGFEFSCTFFYLSSFSLSTQWILSKSSPRSGVGQRKGEWESTLTWDCSISEVFCPFIKKEEQFYSKMPPLREDSGLPITKIVFPLLKSPKCLGFPSLDLCTPILCSHGSASFSVLSLSTQGWSRPSRLVKVMRE